MCSSRSPTAGTARIRARSRPTKGLWSWERSSKTAARLTAATDVAQLVVSQNGQYAAGLTERLAARPQRHGPTCTSWRPASPRGLLTLRDPGRHLPVAPEKSRAPKDTLCSAGGVSNDGQRVVYDDQPPGATSPETVQEWTSGETVQLSPLGATGTPTTCSAPPAPKLEDVFFAAHEPLVRGRSQRGTQDIYDARAQGDFPPCTAATRIRRQAPRAALPPTSTPNPQPPSPSPYTAAFGLATFILPPLPADTLPRRRPSRSR